MSPLNVVGKKGCCEQRWCHNHNGDYSSLKSCVTNDITHK